MKKYLEQRIEELELEVNLLKAKIKLNETKDTSKYLNNYKKHEPLKSYKAYNKCNVTQSCSNNSHVPSYTTPDYMYSPSVNLMSEPELETAFATPFDKTVIEKAPLDTVTVSTPTHSDSDLENIYTDLQNLAFEGCPPYPDIIDSWDKNPDDVVDEYGYKLNYKPETVTTWGFTSEFDKMDKDFLEWLNTEEAKHAYTRYQVETRKNNHVSLNERNIATFRAK